MRPSYPLSNEAAEAIFDSSPDAILLVDKGGRIIRANNQSQFLFGYTRAQLEGMVVEDLIPDRFQAIHREHRAQFMDEPRTRGMGLGVRILAKRRDGREIHVDAALAPVAASHDEYVIVTLRRKSVDQEEMRIPQLFRIISGKNPYQAWLMAFMITVAVPLILGSPPPNSVQALVSSGVVKIWAVSLGGAALVNLLGVYWRGKIETAVYMEFSSSIVLAIANLFYPAALITFVLSNSSGASTQLSNIWFTTILLLAFSVCSAGRAFQICHDRGQLSQVKKLLVAAGISDAGIKR